jgi:predicted branched-subunit amino acid permease
VTRDDARAAVRRQCLSVGLATGAYGVSFGALSVASGLDVAQTCVLSLLLFSGGSQFAVAGVAAAGGGGPSAVATAALLGVRNGIYGLQLAPVLRTRGARTVVAAHLTIDESTAVGTAQLATHPDRPDLARLGFWLTGVTVFLGWNAMTLVGAVVGDALGDPRRYGLDAAAAAAFLALLWPRLRDSGLRRVAAAAALVALAAVPLTPAGVPVLAAGAVALAIGGAVLRREAAVGGPPAGGTAAGGTAVAGREGGV